MNLTVLAWWAIAVAGILVIAIVSLWATFTDPMEPARMSDQMLDALTAPDGSE